MSMVKKHPKRPRDLNQWDKLIVAMGVTGDKKPTPEKQGEDPCAVVRGGTGSLKGGKARAKLSPEERLASERKAILVRWNCPLRQSQRPSSS